VAIGSVEPELVRRCGLPNAPFLQLRDDGCHLEGELTWVLGRIADCLRATGLAHVWRDEQLPVRDAEGITLGSVERAVVRSLGIATEAVHLVGLDPQGRHWMQLRPRQGQRSGAVGHPGGRAGGRERGDRADRMAT